MAPSHEKDSNSSSHPSSDPASFSFSGSLNQGVSKKGSLSYSLKPSNRTSNHHNKSKNSSHAASARIMSLRSHSSKHSKLRSGTQSQKKISNASESLPEISEEKAQVSKVSSSAPEQTRPSDHRVAASSSVNFTYLDDKEQLERYKNKLKEYNTLKAKLKQVEQQSPDQGLNERKRTSIKMTKERQSFKTARKRLRDRPFELNDAHDLIENLAGLLAQKKMEPMSIEFALLAAIVRRVKDKIQFGQKVPLGKREQRFLKVASKEGLIEFFTGIRLNQDRELRGAVFGQNWCDDVSGWRAPKQMGLISASTLPPANAEVGLTAEMLKQFNKDHPLKSAWQRDQQ